MANIPPTSIFKSPDEKLRHKVQALIDALNSNCNM